jgi:uncharacterized protein with PIN domain
MDYTTWKISWLWISGEIVPHDANLAMVAIYAFQNYGKGIHPKARLNF